MPAPYENLRAWKLCHELALVIREESLGWKKDHALAGQIRRASFSAASNIVEGYSKRGPKELRRYLDISLGSLAEVEYGIRFARDAKIIGEETWSELTLLRRRAHGTTRLLYNAITAKIEGIGTKAPGKTNKTHERERHCS
jgi:four helix bundle protein